MPKSSSTVFKAGDPKTIFRVILGTLLAGNLVAAGLILFPPGGSAEALARQMAALQTQLDSQRVALERAKQHAQAIEEGRAEGDTFIGQYFLPLRTADTVIASELQRAGAAAKVTTKDIQISHQAIEGSDTLEMRSATATFEGRYADILKFVHAIDQSQRLLIIESLSAVPQQGSNLLSVNMKVDAFVRPGEGAE